VRPMVVHSSACPAVGDGVTFAGDDDGVTVVADPVGVGVGGVVGAIVTVGVGTVVGSGVAVGVGVDAVQPGYGEPKIEAMIASTSWGPTTPSQSASASPHVSVWSLREPSSTPGRSAAD